MFILYFPVWIDLCAPQRLQTLWICFFYLTEDMGMAVGYGMAAVFHSLGIPWLKWSFGFYVQAALMILVVALMFAVVPAVNFSHEHEALMEHHERAASMHQEVKENKKSLLQKHALSAGNAQEVKKSINEYLPPTKVSSDKNLS